MKKCIYCAEEIQDEATICRFCGRPQQQTAQEAALAKSNAILDEEIRRRVAAGWILMSRTENLAQLRKPKQFNWMWFLVWLIVSIFLIGLPLVIYIIYYAVKKDEIVNLSASEKGELLVNGMLPTALTTTLASTTSTPVPATPLTPEQIAANRASTRRVLIIIGAIILGLIGFAFLCVIVSAISGSHNNIPAGNLTGLALLVRAFLG